jgi:hypothetical protein
MGKKTLRHTSTESSAVFRSWRLHRVGAVPADRALPPEDDCRLRDLGECPVPPTPGDEKHFPGVLFHPEIGSVQRPERLAEVLERYHPSILYHAAAYKHVPMMEAHMFEELENNVFGTYMTALVAADHGVGFRGDFDGQGGSPDKHHGRDQEAGRACGKFVTKWRKRFMSVCGQPLA